MKQKLKTSLIEFGSVHTITLSYTNIPAVKRIESQAVARK